jgi:Tol biopolymer transport system component
VTDFARISGEKIKRDGVLARRSRVLKGKKGYQMNYRFSLLLSFVLSWIAGAQIATGATGVIAYGSPVNGTSQIFLINPDGTGKRQVLQTANSVFAPALSPDGTQIAFFYGGASGSGIYLVNTDGTGLAFVPGSANYANAVWSADGTMLAARHTSSGAVAIFAPDGSGFQVITDTSNDGPRAVNGLTWSPDGRKIAFEGLTFGLRIQQIYLANTSGTGTATRLSTDDNSGYTTPAWSPGASKIACSKNGVVYTLNPASGTETRVTSPTLDPDNFDTYPTWSPDEQHLAVVSSDANNQILIMNANGSARTPLPSGQASYPNWSPAVPQPPPAFTFFSVSGPSSSMAPITFKGTSGARLQVRVESSVTPDGSWVTLADGGFMTEQPAGSGNYTLTTGAYPAGSNVYFRAVTSKLHYPDSVSPKPYPGPFTLHPVTGPLPIAFYVNGSTTPTDNLADTVLSFEASEAGTAAGMTVRVQATTGDPNGTGWKDLVVGNQCQMTYDPASNFWLLSSLNYPTVSGVYFRAVASAQGYHPDAFSGPVGPFDLTSSKPRCGAPELAVTGNGPFADLYFRTYLPAPVSGMTERIQQSSTPVDETTWTDLADSHSGVMSQTNDPKRFYLLAGQIPAGTNIFFRSIVSASNRADGISRPVGPYDITSDIPPTITSFVVAQQPLHGSGSPKDPATFQAGQLTLTINATASSGRQLGGIAILYDGDTLTTIKGSGATLTYNVSGTVPGDHVFEAVAIDDLGATGRTDTRPIYVRIQPPNVSSAGSCAEHASGDNSWTAAAIAAGKVFTLVTFDGNWADASSWKDQDGNPGVPGVNDLAIINAPIFLSQDITVRAISMTDGAIQGGAVGVAGFPVLTVTGAFTVHSNPKSTFTPVFSIHLIISAGASCNFWNEEQPIYLPQSIIDNYGSFNLHGNLAIISLTAFNNHGTTNFQPLLSVPTNAGLDPSADTRSLLAGSITNSGLIRSALISRDGNGLIGQDGNGIVAQGGLNLVNTNGSNIISQDGNSIVGQGGGNIVGQGGGNLVNTNGSNIVGQGGGNLVNTNGSNIVGQGGGNFKTSSGAARSASACSQAEGASAGFVQTGGETNLSGISINGPVTLSGGVLSGSGIIYGSLTNDGGYISPGHSAGAIGVSGDFQQGPNGTLILENGGYYPGQFDQLQVAGKATLGGRLDLKTIKGYRPTKIDLFNPILYSAVAGSFSSISPNVTVTYNAGGAILSNDPSKQQPASGQPENISTRMEVLTSDRVLIGGFIITGSSGTTKKVLIRGMGPTLGKFGVPGSLSDPLIELHYPNGAVETNDDWQQAADHDQIPQGFQPDPKEAALLVDLAPGAYTVIEKGAHGETGIGLTEVYDFGGSSAAALANISTRGFIDTGDNVMIGGFIVTGNEPTQILVRAIGPSLTQYGVAGALADPVLELHDANGNVITNDDWRATQESEIQATTIPPSDDKEPAILATLVPGSYTAIVRGKDNGTGVGLVEAYKIK